MKFVKNDQTAVFALGGLGEIGKNMLFSFKMKSSSLMLELNFSKMNLLGIGYGFQITAI